MTLLTGTDRRDPDRGMAQQRTVTRDMPKLDFRASFEPSTVNVDARTVEVVWTTGAAVLRRGWDGSYFEELSLDPKHVRMGRLQSGAAPLLNAHDGWDIRGILGVVVSARLEKGRGVAIVRFDSGPAGEEAFRMVREGILRNISVGYSTFKMQKVEGGDTTVPTYRAVDWEPAELSLVPIPADAGSVTRSGGGMTPCEFIQERTTMDPDETTTTTTAPAPAATIPAPTADQQRAAADAERARVLGIQRVGRALNRPDAEVDAAIANPATTLEAFRAAAVDALANAPADQGGVIPIQRAATNGGAPVCVSAGADERDHYLRAASDWIIQRAGLTAMMVDYHAKRGEKYQPDPGVCRGMTLADLARDSLERNGTSTRGMPQLEMVGRSFMQRSAGGLNATGDFTVLLENTLHKVLLAAYSTTPDTWRTICKVGSVTDFRPHPRYRQGSFGVLDTVNEGGEFKNATIPDGEKQSITALTKGRIIGLSRQAIINDDMGAFNDIAVRLGRAAALTIEVDFYTLLTSNAGAGPVMGDTLNLFHATHGNIGAGGAALSVATVDADRVLMAQQQDPAKNEYLELRPAVLLLPVGLGGQARVINSAQYDTDKVANARNQEPNKVVGLYRNIVDTARLTGTTRYSFADPSIAPVFEVVFLNGQQDPYMEMQQGWRVDGTEWKIRLDYGIGATDWRGVVRNPGV